MCWYGYPLSQQVWDVWQFPSFALQWGFVATQKSSVPPFGEIKYFSENAYWNLASFKRERNLHETTVVCSKALHFLTEMSGFSWLFIYSWGLFPLQASSEEAILEEEIIREANSQLLSLKNIGQMTNPLQNLAHYLWQEIFTEKWHSRDHAKVVW